MSFVSAARLLLLLIGLSLPALAQNPAVIAPSDAAPEATPAGTKPVDAETEKAALSLLQTVISDADGFKLPDNRFIFKLAAGELLWPHDADKARILYREATAAWLQWMGQLDPENMGRGVGVYQVFRSRARLLESLARHDAALAWELLRQTRAAMTADWLAAFENGDKPDRDLEVTIITQLGAQDTARMLELAQEHLGRYGVSSALVELVKKLKERDRPKSTALGSELVSRLRGEDLRVKGELRQAALELWQASLPDAAGQAGAGEILLERNDFRALSEQLAAVLDKRPGDQSEGEAETVLNALQGQLPLLEKYAPGVAAKVRRKMRVAAGNLATVTAEPGGSGSPTESDPFQQYREKIEKASLPQALDIISQAPEDIREGLYYQLGPQIEQSDDPEQARRLIAEKMPPSNYRQQLLSQLDNKIIGASAGKGEVDKVRGQLLAIRNDDKRYMAWIQAAGSIAAKDRAAALKLLDEIAPALKQPARTVTRLGIQATLLLAYSELEPKKALDVLEVMASRVDELIPAALSLAEFVGEGDLVQDDEFRASMVLEGSSGLLPREITRTLAVLAQEDLGRVKNIAERFQRHEARALARLLVASAVLQKPEDRDK